MKINFYGLVLLINILMLIITYNWRSQLHILKKIIYQQECMREPTLGYI